MELNWRTKVSWRPIFLLQEHPQEFALYAHHEKYFWRNSNTLRRIWNDISFAFFHWEENQIFSSSEEYGPLIKKKQGFDSKATGYQPLLILKTVKYLASFRLFYFQHAFLQIQLKAPYFDIEPKWKFIVLCLN